jgi:glutamate dehydrogenase
MTAATEYALHNKVIDQVLREPGRLPSPQPMHMNAVHGIQQNRILHDHSPGYEAPKFEGKEKQMEQGELELQRLHFCTEFALQRAEKKTL